MGAGEVTMRYYIVDAFTDRPFGGNPAGVVLLGNEPFPDESLMLQVAAELRYSETAFVRRLSAAEYHVRYFTPAAEVELCGHATIATFAPLHRLGLATGRCLCHTLAGDLTIDVGERVMVQMATPRIVETITDTEGIYKALGLNLSKFKIQNSKFEFRLACPDCLRRTQGYHDSRSRCRDPKRTSARHGRRRRRLQGARCRQLPRLRP